MINYNSLGLSMEVNNQSIHSISNKGLENKEILLCLKREDEIHSVVSGNKFRKLKYNLMAAKRRKKDLAYFWWCVFKSLIVPQHFIYFMNICEEVFSKRFTSM